MYLYKDKETTVEGPIHNVHFIIETNKMDGNDWLENSWKDLPLNVKAYQ